MRATDITVAKIQAIAKTKGYIICPMCEGKSCQFHLNIGGVRTASTSSSNYDDFIFIYRKASKPTYHTIDRPNFIRRYENGYILDIYVATTNPGTPWMLKPMNPKGAAILKPGFYRKAFKKGLHKGYPALIQASPLTVYRDNDKDAVLDYNVPTETGMFNIDLHRASQYKVVDAIGLYSAGCQVVKDVNEFEDILMWTINSAVQECVNYYDYMLLEEKDFV